MFLSFYNQRYARHGRAYSESFGFANLRRSGGALFLFSVFRYYPIHQRRDTTITPEI